MTQRREFLKTGAAAGALAFAGPALARAEALAQRIAPASPNDKAGRVTKGGSGGTGGGRWQRVRPIKQPQVGLAAFKHAEREDRRASLTRDFDHAESVIDRVEVDRVAILSVRHNNKYDKLKP